MKVHIISLASVVAATTPAAHLHCGGTSFCNASGRLHETDRLTSGQYRLVEGIYKSGND